MHARCCNFAAQHFATQLLAIFIGGARRWIDAGCIDLCYPCCNPSCYLCAVYCYFCAASLLPLCCAQLPLCYLSAVCSYPSTCVLLPLYHVQLPLYFVLLCTARPQPPLPDKFPLIKLTNTTRRRCVSCAVQIRSRRRASTSVSFANTLPL